MKKRHSQILLLLMAAGLLLSSSLTGVLALETSNTDITPTGGNSGSILKIDTFVNSTFDHTFALSFEDLVAMPKTTVYAELSCYGRFIESGQWGGVSLSLILERAGFNEQTAQLEFLASDGYAVPFSFSDATPKDVIIAYDLDSSPLPETLRLVIPDANGESWISMITVISINNPTYPVSPNPAAASIVFDQPPPQQSPTPQPSPTPELRNQSTIQPTVPPPTNQPVPQQDAPISNLQTEYSYLALFGIISAAALVTGYLFYKRRK